ncbi:MAG: hypothetical protein P8X74_14690 [Reinekea sp.]
MKSSTLDNRSGKLPITIGILSWKSKQSISNTLNSYSKNRLFDIVSESIIFLQEASNEDIEAVNNYSLKTITTKNNIGIGKAFLELASVAQHPYIILLEHDWELVENAESTKRHLQEAINLIEEHNVDCIRLRHRKKFGFPHYSVIRYRGKELDFFDPWIKLTHPHLLDSVHWTKNPSELWPDKINRLEDFFVCSSRYGNWTNNPCIFKKNFYSEVVRDFAGEGIELEEKISYWWARQNFKVAQGRGLFRHRDIDKYGRFKE